MSEQMTTRQQAAYREVMDRFPGLAYQRSQLLSAGIEPSSVLIPARLNIAYAGDDATSNEATCMGLPVTWSSRERWGLVVELPEPRTTST